MNGAATPTPRIARDARPYDLTEWRDPATADYCEWCAEGSESLADIGKHRHAFYAQRAGASNRTADELAQVFLFDVADIVTTYTVPTELAALELESGTGSGWCDDPDDAQALSDEIIQAESALADVGLSAVWDDGYVIERVETWMWDDDTARELARTADRMFSDHYTGHTARPEHRDECGGCVLGGWRGSKDVRAEWNVRGNGPNYAGWARLYAAGRRRIPDTWAHAFVRELESDNTAYAEALRRDLDTFGPVRLESGATIGADGIVRSTAELER